MEDLVDALLDFEDFPLPNVSKLSEDECRDLIVKQAIKITELRNKQRCLSVLFKQAVEIAVLDATQKSACEITRLRTFLIDNGYEDVAKSGK